MPEIKDVGSLDTTLTGTELFPFQEAAGGASSTKRTTLQAIANATPTTTFGLGAVTSGAAGASYAFDYITVQASGGSSSTSPVGFLVSCEATGGTIGHVVGLMGNLQPGASDVQGDRYAVEGRVDQAFKPTTLLSSICTGVLGFASLNHATDNSNHVVVGVRGQVEKNVGNGGGSGFLGIGGWFTANDCLLNYAAIFGDGAASGHNAFVGYRGYISSSGGGEAEAIVYVDDAYDALFYSLNDARLLGMVIQLKDTAGAASVQIIDSAGAEQFAVDSAANVRLNGAITWGAGSGSPEGVRTANVGSLWSRTDGGATTSLYVKTSGSGNTGWTGK